MSANLTKMPKTEILKKNQIDSEQSKNWNPGYAQGGNVDFLHALELQLKEIWSQYISYLDKNGFDESAKSLKSKYFSLYQNYQKNKNWRNAVTNN